jgi:RHS repeat-associated protein
VTRYEYDALGNLMNVSLADGRRVDYVIDAAGRRIGRKINGVLVQGLLYHGDLAPAAELDGQNNVVTSFVYATRSNVPDQMVKNGVSYAIITDHLGSVRLVINSVTGEVVQQISYDSWGQMIENTNPGFQPFGYGGGLYDEDTKLLRFGVRDYDPSTGRWNSKDPIGFGAVSANLYEYVMGDPVNYADPSGLDPCFLSTAFGTVIVDQSIAARTSKFINDAVALGYTEDQGGAINESFRTTAEQTELYNRRGQGNVSERVAKPRNSPHEAGFSLDFNFREACPEARKALLKAAKLNGFGQSYPEDDPAHFFAGEWGPFSGKTAAIKHNQNAVQGVGGSKANFSACFP